VYQQQFVLAVTGVPDEAALRAGLDDLVARHTVLRTGFVWEGVDTPVQVVFAEAPVELAVAGTVEEALATQWATPFDLRRPPLLRAHAVRVGAAEWRLVCTVHHLVVDGWSIPTLQADLTELLTARLAGRATTLPPAAPFREFVTWLREHNPDAGAHFKRLLGDLRHPTPLGIDRIGRVSTGGGPAGRVELYAPGDPARQPGTLARRRGLLPSTIAHAAWGLLLARCAGTPDAVFGTTVSGRPAELPGVTERVGMFVNTVPVRVDVDGGLPVGPWLAALQEQLIAGRAFEHTPVATAQRCSGVPLGEPLYESVLGVQNYFVDGPSDDPAGPVTVRALRQREQTGLPLVVSVALPAHGTWVRVEFDEGRIDRPVAEWLADRYRRLLGELAEAEDSLPLRDIVLAEPVEIPPRPAGPLPAWPPLAGVRAGERVLLRLPAAELVPAALAALAAGADVGVVPSGASAAELLEHCAGAAALIVPAGTEFAVPPPAPVVYFGHSAGEPVPLSGRWRGMPVETLAESVAVVGGLFAEGESAVIPLAADDPALLPVALAALGAGARPEFSDPREPVAWCVHATEAACVFAWVPRKEAGLGVVAGRLARPAGARRGGRRADHPHRRGRRADRGVGAPPGRRDARAPGRPAGQRGRLGGHPARPRRGGHRGRGARRAGLDRPAHRPARAPRPASPPSAQRALPGRRPHAHRTAPHHHRPGRRGRAARAGACSGARRAPPPGRPPRRPTRPAARRVPGRPARRPERGAADPPRTRARSGTPLGAAGVLRHRARPAHPRRVHNGHWGGGRQPARLRRLCRLAGRSAPDR
jgi:hypothetical protein